jgi:hypothetical protein
VLYTDYMGFFDDITNFVLEAKSMGNEMNEMKKDVIKELRAESTAVSKTLQETATGISETVSNVSQEMKTALTINEAEKAEPATEPATEQSSTE